MSELQRNKEVPCLGTSLFFHSLLDNKKKGVISRFMNRLFSNGNSISIGDACIYDPSNSMSQKDGLDLKVVIVTGKKDYNTFECVDCHFNTFYNIDKSLLKKINLSKINQSVVTRFPPNTPEFTNADVAFLDVAIDTFRDSCEVADGYEQVKALTELVNALSRLKIKIQFYTDFNTDK